MSGTHFSARISLLQVAALIGSAVAQAPAPSSDCTPLPMALEMNGLTELATIIATPGAKELAFDAASTFELPELDKVTIFAPDDAALMSAPTTNVTAEVLYNHIVLQYLPSETITGPTDALSLGGLVSLTSGTGGGLEISAPGMPAPAMITSADIQTCVGVVHTTDAVITRTSDGSVASDPAAGPLVGEDVAGPEAGPDTGAETGATGGDVGASSTGDAARDLGGDSVTDAASRTQLSAVLGVAVAAMGAFLLR